MGLDRGNTFLKGHTNGCLWYTPPKLNIAPEKMMVRRFEHEIPSGARPIFRGYVKLQECIVKTWNLFVTLYFGDSTQPSKKKAVAFGNEKTQ